MQIITVFACVLLGCFQSSGGWRGIVPLQSNRADVERVLGPPTNPKKGSLIESYELGREIVTVLYATGPPCGNHGEDEWQVPRNTVIRLTVYSDEKRRFSELHIDGKKYKKIADGHLPGVLYYVNDEDGIKIQVQQGRVDSVTYFPAAKDSHLHCPRNSDEAELSGDLTAKERELLDKFIFRLKQEPQSTGLIMIDFERKRIWEFKLGERIMDYLKNKHSSDFGRIKLMEMGRLKNEMELFIMPPKGKLIPFP